MSFPLSAVSAVSGRQLEQRLAHRYFRDTFGGANDITQDKAEVD
jgi:hypothetical protein